MTDTTASTVGSVPSAVTWSVPRAGVWVAERDGAFAGLVTARWGHGFTATTPLGKELGTFATVRDAQSALEQEVVL